MCGVNSLKYNWQREISKFCKNEKAIVLGTKVNTKGRTVETTIAETKKQIESCPEEFFWIINIEKIRITKNDDDTIIDYLNEQIKKKNLGMLIVDEVHKISNLESAQAKGLLALDSSLSKMLMTGTLLVNNPYDLYCPMTLCGLINYNKWQFENKFIIKDEWKQPIGFKNMDELHQILYKSSLRRTKDLLNLPEKVYKQEWLEFSKEEISVFNQVTGNESFKLEKIEEPNELMAVITRMRQATVATELLTAKVKKSTKFDRLNDILEEARLNGQKVLVFCPFTQALELGLEYCSKFKPKLIRGGMKEKVQQVVDEHENTNGFSVIFAQEATLGVGYTLTNTEICVFLSPPWNRANYDQCSDRCFAKNTIVMTTKGPKYIQDIVCGDYVYTPYGNIKKVIATHKIPTNNKMMTKIQIYGLDKAFEIICTADHKILDCNGNWRDALSYKVGEKVYSIPEKVDIENNIKKYIDMTQYIESSYKSLNSQGKVKTMINTYLYEDKLEINTELMFLLGFYLGDGFIQKDFKKIGFCGNCTTKLESLYRIERYIKSISNAKTNIDIRKDSLSRQLNVRLEPLARFIELNFGRVCEEKYIPQWIFNLDKKLLQSLLDGLIASDGSKIETNNVNNSIYYSYDTTTPAIATGVWFLCYRLGYKARFNTKFLYKKDTKREYIISFTLQQNNIIRADRTIKTGMIKNIKTYSIKNHKNTVLYDISVEDDECYMVGNLPVHNCHRIGQKKTVQIIDLLIKDTYDELIYKKLHGKGAMADMLIDGKEDEVVKKYLQEANIIFKKENSNSERLNLFDKLDIL